MSEFRISIVGRARVGKSLLLTRFVKEPEKIIGLSSEGSDSTKVITELVLQNETKETTIKCHYKDNSDNIEDIPIDELTNFHERIKKDEKLQEKIEYISIEAKPSKWVEDVLKETDTNKLVVVDTKGVSGNVKELSLREWKTNLFILLLRSSESKEEFVKSINKMKSALIGNDIWYAVSLDNRTLTSDKSEIELEIEELEKAAIKIKEDFSSELDKLEDKKSLLNMKFLESKRRSTILAIPNITIQKKQYESGRNYTDKKLEGFLKDVIINKGKDIELELDKTDKKQCLSAKNLLKSLKKHAMNIINENKENELILTRESALKKHLNDKNRLKSDDNSYLVDKQWDASMKLKDLILKEISKIKVNSKSNLSMEQQAALAQFFMRELNKMVWTDYFIKSKDKRESNEQASIIVMLYASEVKRELLNESNNINDVLVSAIKTEGWEKNYLVDENRESDMYIPIYCASKYQDKYESEFDKFYYLIIRPYAVYAVNSALLKLGYESRNNIIDEF